MNATGRRCQVLERRIEKWAEAGEVAFGTVVQDNGATLAVEVAGTVHTLPRKHVNVADASGKFANSLRKRGVPGCEPATKMRGEEAL